MRSPALIVRIASIACIVAALNAVTTRAAQPTDAPIVRIDTAMHTALVRRIAVDEAGARLVSAADDKTIRVWRMSDGRLERVIRVPIDQQHEGQLFGLALSPDGRWVAAGGWTCWDWERAGCLYIFDVSTGALARRIGGFPDAISALAWSPDGQRLAVGLQGEAGIRILSATTFTERARDAAYRDKVMELDFDRRGRLAVVALDGFARVYRQDGSLHARSPIKGGRKPASVRFSPDGSRLAVGFVDAAATTIVAAHDLASLIVRRAVDGQKSLSSVAWSADGLSHYAAGEKSTVEANVILRWALAKEATAERIPIASRRISELRTIADGRLAYAAEDPQIGILDRSGQVLISRIPEIVDFSDVAGALMLSPDATIVAFSARGSRRVFSIRNNDGSVRPHVGEEAVGPLRLHANWRIDRWQGGDHPLINGRTPALDDYEVARSYALSHDGAALLLGTEWAIRLLDREARERWHVKLAAVVRAVNIAPNGQFAVAALADGTLRWYRMRDGLEVLAYFPHANGADWIAWTPAGYYMSSANGDQFVGWHLNRGMDAMPDFHRAVQFERLLYRPDIVTASLAEATRSGTRGSGDRVSPAPDFDISRLREITPPRLSIERLPAPPGRGTVARLRIEAERTGPAMHDLTVFVNDIPVTPYVDRLLRAEETNRFSREMEIPLSAPDNEIRVESNTTHSMGVAQLFASSSGRPGTDAPGDLYLLAIGNNVFPNLAAATQLEFASRDAEAFARALGAQHNSVFRRANVRILSDQRTERATKRAILEAVQFLQNARATDTVVVFLASHGISDKAGNYYLVPRDAALADMEAIARDPARDDYPSLVSWSIFFDALRKAAGKRILIVDTCQARGIEGRFEPHALMKRSVSSRFALMVAAKADEESQEYEPGQHGLFTYALLEALGGAADTNGDGRITARELFDAAKPIVDRLHDRATGPQTPQIILPRALDDAVVASARAAAP